jgi:hypothetical protein
MEKKEQQDKFKRSTDRPVWLSLAVEVVVRSNLACRTSIIAVVMDRFRVLYSW